MNTSDFANLLSTYNFQQHMLLLLELQMSQSSVKFNRLQYIENTKAELSLQFLLFIQTPESPC